MWHNVTDYVLKNYVLESLNFRLIVEDKKELRYIEVSRSSIVKSRNVPHVYRTKLLNVKKIMFQFNI